MDLLSFQGHPAAGALLSRRARLRACCQRISRSGRLGTSTYCTRNPFQRQPTSGCSEGDGEVVPWQALINLIEPHYPKASKKGGRPPYPLATMLRVHLLQQWYSLSDPAMEEALIEVPTMRRFAGIELISDRIPDETTILTFRHLLEKHKLGGSSLRPSRLTSTLGA